MFWCMQLRIFNVVLFQRKKTSHAWIFVWLVQDCTDNAAIQALCGNLSRNEFTCNLSGNILPQSSQLARPLQTDPGIRSGINARELISTSWGRGGGWWAQAGNEWSNILPTSSQAKKKTSPLAGDRPRSLEVREEVKLHLTLHCHHHQNDSAQRLAAVCETL